MVPESRQLINLNELHKILEQDLVNLDMEF